MVLEAPQRFDVTMTSHAAIASDSLFHPLTLTEVCNLPRVEFCFWPEFLCFLTYLSGASEALRLCEEICKGHKEDERQVGEEKNKVPKT